MEKEEEKVKEFFILVDFTKQEQLDKFVKLTKPNEEQLKHYEENNIKLLMFSLNTGIIQWYINTSDEIMSADGNIAVISDIDLDKLIKTGEGEVEEVEGEEKNNI
jgi:hypothetical protein